MKTYLISEIGINHNGSMDIAKKLIDISALAGFNAVKFQKRNPDVCVPEHQKNIEKDTPWGTMTYLEYKYKVEFEKEEYDEIDAYCKSRGIDWSASPWDEDSIDFLSDYKLPWVKIASASITEEDVLRKCAKIFPKIIMSTGMSTEEEIDRAVSVLESANCESICILHCNSSYPAPAEDLNLNYIKELKKKYPKHQIGYSGHEYGLTSSIASVALGAEVVERHVTLDKSMWGSDQLCSVEPHGMFKLARGIKELESALGDGIKVVTEDEKKKRKTLRK